MTLFVDEKAMGNVMFSILFPVVPHCLDFADNYHVAVDVFGVTRNISIPMRVAAICFDIVGCNV